MLKFNDNTGDHCKNYMAFSEGNQLFAGDVRANLDETNADMVQFTKKWNWKDFLASKYFYRKLAATNVSSAPKYVHLQGWLSWSLKLSDGWEKYKEKVPDLWYSNRNIENKCNSKLKIKQQFYNFKFSAVDVTSGYVFLLRLVNTFTIDTEDYYARCYKV